MRSMWRDGVRGSRFSEVRDMLGGRLSCEEEGGWVLRLGWLPNGDTEGSSMEDQHAEREPRLKKNKQVRDGDVDWDREEDKLQRKIISKVGAVNFPGKSR